MDDMEEVTKVLWEEEEGEFPEDEIDQLALPCVGGNMVIQLQYYCGDNSIGIPVEEEITRVVNRIGWVNAKDPAVVKKELETFVRRRYWGEMYPLFVGLG